MLRTSPPGPHRATLSRRAMSAPRSGFLAGATLLAVVATLRAQTGALTEASCDPLAPPARAVRGVHTLYGEMRGRARRPGAGSALRHAAVLRSECGVRRAPGPRGAESGTHRPPPAARPAPAGPPGRPPRAPARPRPPRLPAPGRQAHTGGWPSPGAVHRRCPRPGRTGL